jgi:hypothetical protein
MLDDVSEEPTAYMFSVGAQIEGESETKNYHFLTRGSLPMSALGFPDLAVI